MCSIKFTVKWYLLFSMCDSSYRPNTMLQNSSVLQLILIVAMRDCCVELEETMSSSLEALSTSVDSLTSKQTRPHSHTDNDRYKPQLGELCLRLRYVTSCYFNQASPANTPVLQPASVTGSCRIWWLGEGHSGGHFEGMGVMVKV